MEWKITSTLVPGFCLLVPGENKGLDGKFLPLQATVIHECCVFGLKGLNGPVQINVLGLEIFVLFLWYWVNLGLIQKFPTPWSHRSVTGETLCSKNSLKWERCLSKVQFPVISWNAIFKRGGLSIHYKRGTTVLSKVKLVSNDPTSTDSLQETMSPVLCDLHGIQPICRSNVWEQ